MAISEVRLVKKIDLAFPSEPERIRVSRDEGSLRVKEPRRKHYYLIPEFARNGLIFLFINGWRWLLNFTLS